MISSGSSCRMDVVLEPEKTAGKGGSVIFCLSVEILKS